MAAAMCCITGGLVAGWSPPVTGAQFTSDHPSPTSYSAPIPASIPVPAYQLWGSVIPPMDFPQFDGQNPKMWQKKCE